MGIRPPITFNLCCLGKNCSINLKNNNNPLATHQEDLHFLSLAVTISLPLLPLCSPSLCPSLALCLYLRCHSAFFCLSFYQCLCDFSRTLLQCYALPRGLYHWHNGFIWWKDTRRFLTKVGHSLRIKLLLAIKWACNIIFFYCSLKTEGNKQSTRMNFCVKR